MRRTVAEAAVAMGGEILRGDPDARWTRASLDSRRVEGGELFFALRGERVDGHDFVVAALQRGAAGAVVERAVKVDNGTEAAAGGGPATGATPLMPSGALIRVPKVYDALHALTRAVRREVPQHLVGITGSSGKTTTKELLALCLGRKYRVSKSAGNLNNLLGFPLTLLSTPENTEWLVAEMGMSLSGELAEISRMARPDVALFTNVRPVHLEGLGSLEAIAAAKSELLEGLANDGLVVANADDRWVRWIAARWTTRGNGRVVWYGGDSEYRIEGVTARNVAAAGRRADETQPGGTRFRLVTPEGAAAVELPLHGAYNAENFLAAAACAHTLGVPLAAIVEAAASAAPVGGRGAVRALGNGATLIDDSYNSNPVALRRALESARALPGKRHWAVLGDMLELGPEAPRFHREEGEAAARLGFAPVAGVGELSRALVEGAAAGAESHWFSTAAEAAAWAKAQLRPGDVVLVKGSRGVHLEKVVAALLSDAPGEAEGGH
ncbi:MAG TPA: UDP-N-acetylmuramoyl-tripeptide--D-alanyl-D-alanine ligase [Thermoanaerobaculia bacterium]|nr:UDP-N-acetylmuramoyl-tripeptide--D-alanyl-D-alanine ligase [Thermoanaerobaculia bacterium]